MIENNTTVDIASLNDKIERESAFVDLLTSEINKVIVGQKHMVERLLIGLLGQGHILLEGVPGLAKPLPLIPFPSRCRGSSAGYSLHQTFFLQMLWELLSII
jgi:MoxR-like ATPase